MVSRNHSVKLMMRSLTHRPAYSRSDVERLLSAWPMLADGRVPSRSTVPPGYRGKSRVEEAPWAYAIRCKADLEQAIARLPHGIAAALVQRFWLGRRTHRAKGDLVDAVYRSING